MEENKVKLQTTDSGGNIINKTEVSSTCPYSATQQQRETVCSVCGHINKGQSLICEMCSNYLFD